MDTVKFYARDANGDWQPLPAECREVDGTLTCEGDGFRMEAEHVMSQGIYAKTPPNQTVAMFYLDFEMAADWDPDD